MVPIMVVGKEVAVGTNGTEEVVAVGVGQRRLWW